MELALHHLATLQGGVFTRRQALLCGESDRSLADLRESGEVVRVRQGAYAVGTALASASPERRLAVRSRAILCGLAEHVAASHQSSLALQGLPLHGVRMMTTDVVDRVLKARLRAGLRRHPMEGVPSSSTTASAW